MTENTGNFDKKKFNFTTSFILLLGLGIGLIGVIAIILSLFVGTGLAGTNISKGKDPKDYYATYYTCDGYEYRSFKFDKDNCHYTASTGIVTVEEYDYKYDFVSEKYAQTVVEGAKYSDRKAIIVYTDSAQIYGITLWVMSSEKNNYVFEIDKNGATLTTKPITMSEYCGDTRDYYGKYTNGNNYVEISTDGKAVYYKDGRTINGICTFVNNAWLKKYSNGVNFEKALVLYDERNDSSYIFGFKGNDLITTAGNQFDRITIVNPPSTPSTPDNDEYQLSYELDTTTQSYYVAGINGNPKSITIPETYENIPVVGIAANVFNNCSNLESVTLPNQINIIESCAFENCTKLKTINIPVSVAAIYDNAFKGCTSLTSVEFEDTENWSVVDVTDYNETSISKSLLNNPATAATYLTDTYCSYMWINMSLL